MKKDCFVIAVAGASGSGKTELVKELARILNGSIMYFDNYSHLMEEIEEEREEEGENGKENPNPRKLRISQMTEDLKKLIAGEIIEEPKGGRIVKPAKYIIIEDPHGRERNDIGQYYDYVVLVDTPLELCLVRVLIRMNEGEYIQREKTGELIPQEKADPKEKLLILEKFINGTYWTREHYIAINNYVRKKADLILDGLSSVEEMAKEVKRKLNR